MREEGEEEYNICVQDRKAVCGTDRGVLCARWRDKGSIMREAEKRERERERERERGSVLYCSYGVPCVIVYTGDMDVLCVVLLHV